MKMHNLQEWDTSEIGTLWSSPNGVPISEVTLYTVIPVNPMLNHYTVL